MNILVHSSCLPSGQWSINKCYSTWFLVMQPVLGISSSFLDIRLPSQDPIGIFCMYGQPAAPCALESESSSLWLLPAPTPSWHLPSVKGHFGHVGMSFQIFKMIHKRIPAHSAKYSTSEYFKNIQNWRHFIYFLQSEDIKVWLCSLRGHQLRHIHSNLSQSKCQSSEFQWREM